MKRSKVPHEIRSQKKKQKKTPHTAMPYQAILKFSKFIQQLWPELFS